jgi:hypothetical protein
MPIKIAVNYRMVRTQVRCPYIHVENENERYRGEIKAKQAWIQKKRKTDKRVSNTSHSDSVARRKLKPVDPVKASEA